MVTSDILRLVGTSSALVMSDDELELSVVAFLIETVVAVGESTCAAVEKERGMHRILL